MQHVENVHFDVSVLRIGGLLQVVEYDCRLAVVPSQRSAGKLKFSCVLRQRLLPVWSCTQTHVLLKNKVNADTSLPDYLMRFLNDLKRQIFPP